VAILSVPNSLKFPALFVRPRASSDAREGLLDSFPLGLGGGLRERVRGEPRRDEESSGAEGKCLALAVGMGGNIVGDCAESPYRDVFLRTVRGGELCLLVGVETGDAR
jgi:hypothetical protein